MKLGANSVLAGVCAEGAEAGLCAKHLRGGTKRETTNFCSRCSMHRCIDVLVWCMGVGGQDY